MLSELFDDQTVVTDVAEILGGFEEVQHSEMVPVIVESPFGSPEEAVVHRNKAYLERCLFDCIMRGESPYASHKMLTSCLDDRIPAERELGIAAGYIWRLIAKKRIFYVDLGWSSGMLKAKELYDREGLSYETRAIGL